MPNTVNVALEVPITGSMVGTWGSNALNPNFAALDGLSAGVVQIAVSNAPVTLTAPAAVVTPGPGPFQSLNRALLFTGAMTANVQVTFPLPGKYLVVNQTTGSFSFVLSFRGLINGGNLVAVPAGGYMEIFNDGRNCWFANNMATPGQLIFLGGESALPPWMLACTVLPFLAADGAIYNTSDFPALGSRYGSKFGGNGITTFGVPDLRGRVPLAYDGTGTRITVGGGAGFSGQSMGAAGGQQGSSLGTSNMPPYTPSGSVSSSFSGSGSIAGTFGAPVAAGGDASVFWAFGGATGVSVSGSVSSSFSGSAQGGSSTTFSNVMPTQVAGIWMVKT